MKCPFPDFGNIFCKILEMDDGQLGKKAFLCPRCPRVAAAPEDKRTR